MRRGERSDRGMTLLEVVIATGITLIVVGTVGSGVRLLSQTTSTMQQTTQAIDEIQLAEQKVVQDLHGATSWCVTPPTTTQLEFTTSVGGTTQAVDIQINTADNELIISTASTCAGLGNATGTVWLTNVDSAASTPVSLRSGFSQAAGGPPSVTVSSTTYYTHVAVTLTVDTPKVGAGNAVRTTVADPLVEIWNAEQACVSQWLASAAGGTDPC